MFRSHTNRHTNVSGGMRYEPDRIQQALSFRTAHEAAISVKNSMAWELMKRKQRSTLRRQTSGRVYNPISMIESPMHTSAGDFRP